jgi:hypothetical protein
MLEASDAFITIGLQRFATREAAADVCFGPLSTKPAK